MPASGYPCGMKPPNEKPRPVDAPDTFETGAFFTIASLIAALFVCVMWSLSRLTEWEAVFASHRASIVLLCVAGGIAASNAICERFGPFSHKPARRKAHGPG